MLLFACAQEPAPSAPDNPKAPATNWKSLNGSKVVRADDATDTALATAIKQARATAETARAQWTTVNDVERQHWAIKWAAPTADHAIEHVWVRPVNWSPFRVEGVLISNPVTPLECGRHEGEIVSFPIEELSDWIHYLQSPNSNQPNPNERAEFDGGFTVKALESRYGRP